MCQILLFLSFLCSYAKANNQQSCFSQKFSIGRISSNGSTSCLLEKFTEFAFFNVQRSLKKSEIYSDVFYPLMKIVFLTPSSSCASRFFKKRLPRAVLGIRISLSILASFYSRFSISILAFCFFFFLLFYISLCICLNQTKYMNQIKI